MASAPDPVMSSSVLTWALRLLAAAVGVWAQSSAGSKLAARKNAMDRDFMIDSHINTTAALL